MFSHFTANRSPELAISCLVAGLALVAVPLDNLITQEAIIGSAIFLVPLCLGFHLHRKQVQQSEDEKRQLKDQVERANADMVSVVGRVQANCGIRNQTGTLKGVAKHQRAYINEIGSCAASLLQSLEGGDCLSNQQQAWLENILDQAANLQKMQLAMQGLVSPYSLDMQPLEVGNQIAIILRKQKSSWPGLQCDMNLEAQKLWILSSPKEWFVMMTSLMGFALKNTPDKKLAISTSLQGSVVHIATEFSGATLPHVGLEELLLPFGSVVSGLPGDCGLAVVEKIVREWGGTLTIEPLNSKVVIRMSFQQINPKKEEVPTIGKTLIVEDNPPCSKLLISWLGSNPGNVLDVVDNAEEALRILSDDPSYETVLCDGELNGAMKGGTMLEEVAERYPSVVTAAVSAGISSPDGINADVIHGKPIMIRELGEQLAAAHAKKRKNR